jgi:hypothetical protein
MTGSETVNLMEMTGDTMEVFYEAVAKSGESDSDVEIEWSVTSDYPEDIKISDEGVMTVTGNVQPGAEAEVSASLPEYFPDNMRVTKKRLVVSLPLTSTYETNRRNFYAVFRCFLSDEARTRAGSRFHSLWCVDEQLPGRCQAAHRHRC